MADVPIDHDVIEQLGRSLFGQLSPLTGTRGTGQVTVVNSTGSAIVLPKNMYLLPVKGTIALELADDLVFKTRANPATLREHGQGGDWTIPANSSLAVGIWSNLGGARHNLPAGTLFYWDPPLVGLPPTVTLLANITDGVDKPDDPVIQRAVYYEQLSAASLQSDLHKGRLSQLPGVILTWEQSTPLEGRASGANQGSTRPYDTVRIFAENYRLFVVVGSYQGDKQRRSSGLVLMQAITRLISDQVMTRDYETLCNLGSLEILNRQRFTRDDRTYVYSLAFRLNRSIKRLEERDFNQWLKTREQATLPGRPSPEPTSPIELVDVEFPIPPGT